LNSFGILSEYNARANKKLVNTHQVEEKPNFFVTSSRPGNFGDHIDFKINITTGLMKTESTMNTKLISKEHKYML